jgi:ubiquitin fusion degradation protein 1
LFIEEGALIKVRNVTLPRATFVKLQPHTTSFINIANPKAVLEVALRNFSCLTKDEVICIDYNDTKYYINVVEVQPSRYNAVSIVETDVRLDFAPPLDYVEPEPPSKRQVSAARARVHACVTQCASGQSRIVRRRRVVVRRLRATISTLACRQRRRRCLCSQ